MSGSANQLANVMARLRGNGYREQPLEILIVAAHPDDEIIGAGAQLPHWPGAEFVLVTDGSPRDLRDARRAGLDTREEYAAMRRQELDRALSLAGQGGKVMREIGLVDQEASLHLTSLANSLLDLFRTVKPDVVLTHSYEGGHPDHDATAFAVHVAAQAQLQNDGWHPLLLEMASYHARAGRMESQEFLPAAETPSVTFELSPEERQFKQRLFECFPSQSRVLGGFAIERERFRCAPEYNFQAPPHEGTLYYETFKWGMTGECWRELAGRALAESGLSTVQVGSNREYVVNCP